MPLTLRLASRNLFNDRLRFSATIIGIVFSVVLVMVQMGLFLGFDKMVTTMIDQPKLWTNPSLNQFTSRNSGFAKTPIHPKSTTCSNLGLMRFSRSTSLGPTNNSNLFNDPSDKATPGNWTGFSSSLGSRW